MCLGLKSGGSTGTASNSTSSTESRSQEDDDDQGSSPSPTAEVSVKELEVEVEQKGAEEKEEMMAVEVDKEDVKKDDDGGKIEDAIAEDRPLPNTFSTMTVKRSSMDPIPPVTATTSMGSDHKNSSSSTSIASVVRLKRKGSSDIIKTIKSSPPVPIVVVDAPLTKVSSDTVKPAPIVDAPLAKQFPPIRLHTTLHHPLRLLLYHASLLPRGNGSRPMRGILVKLRVRMEHGWVWRCLCLLVIIVVVGHHRIDVGTR